MAFYFHTYVYLPEGTRGARLLKKNITLQNYSGMFKKEPVQIETQERKTFLYFTWLYASALLIVAVISILSQILIQRYLTDQRDDSHIINYAGRLRTYSQTLSKTALLIESGRDLGSNQKEFVNTLKQWQKAHEALIGGNSFLNLPPNNRKEIAMMYDMVKEPYHEILTAANSMMVEMEKKQSTDSVNIKPYVKKILEYEKSYLLGMELIVFDYDRFWRQKVRTLKEIEYILLGVVLFTLLLEAALIFFPLSVRIRQTMTGLIDSENRSKKLAEQLQESSKSIEKSHKELRETNYALEKATYLVKTDRDGNIIYANDRYCYVTKYNLSELKGRPLFYNNHGGDESIIYQHIRNPERKIEVWQGEVFDTASDGSGFWLDVTMMPIIDNYGDLYQYLVVSNDITKRKNTENELWLLTDEKMHRKETEQHIRSLSIITGQEKERERVAAEIHDGIGQMLTSLRMKLEQVDDRMEHKDPEILKVNELLSSIIFETKRICADLLPSVLEDFGLRSAIRELVKTCRETASSITFHLEENIQVDSLPREVEIGVFRILQEALNNAIKHSQAKTIEIHVDNDIEFLNMIIQDNGKGFYFDSQYIYSREKFPKAHGLRGMKERADLLNSVINISSEPGNGTTVQLELPLRKNNVK
ncbi:PAS domain S-box protein [Dyadobacter sp. CY312]|uniref:PAS domain S-box protein n=1 Tax=Dyadobacter sp. CY312 TaxID=2907303 RepID=UPI001F1ABF0D|nr:PAS domain S-box protein [Dyadobacter sp. CY312]MCE7042668.1 PAS domain S-box protein [Dyadobacter sp. CY312]